MDISCHHKSFLVISPPWPLCPKLKSLKFSNFTKARRNLQISSYSQKKCCREGCLAASCWSCCLPDSHCWPSPPSFSVCSLMVSISHGQIGVIGINHETIFKFVFRAVTSSSFFYRFPSKYILRIRIFEHHFLMLF